MRILLIADFYPPHVGGVELQVQALARALVARGDEVHVATVAQTNLAAESSDGPIRIHRFRGLFTALPGIASQSDRRYHPPLPDPLVAWAIRRLVRKIRPDAAQVHGWIAYSAALGLVRSSIPLIVSVRDYGYICPTRNLLIDGRICSGPGLAKCLGHASRVYGVGKGVPATLTVLGLRSWLARRTRVVHAVSGFVGMTMRRSLLTGAAATTPITTIADVVLAEPPDSATGGTRAASGLPDEPYILFVGALQPHKGLEPLLSAHASLGNAPPLVLIGTRWPDTPAFPAHLTVLENVPHAEVMAAWDGALFGVAPSIWPDPLPGVVREAMSRGRPVIGTTVGGIVDMIEDGVTGLLVAPNDAPALAAAMRRLIEEPGLAAHLGEAAQIDVARFTPEAIGTSFAELYAVTANGLSRERLRRVHIIGGPGVGKSTLARRLGRELELPVHHLDDIARETAGATDPHTSRHALAKAIAAQPRWVTDGVHLDWTEVLLEAADAIIWLDAVPWPLALARVIRRFVQGAIGEARSQRGLRRIGRFRSYARHTGDLIRIAGEIRGFDRSGDGRGSNRAALSRAMVPHLTKVVRCRGDQAIDVILATVARNVPGPVESSGLLPAAPDAPPSPAATRDSASSGSPAVALNTSRRATIPPENGASAPHAEDFEVRPVRDGGRPREGAATAEAGETADEKLDPA